MKESPKRVGKFANEQIAQWFKPNRPNTRYQIRVAAYSPWNGYNLFFEFTRPKHWTRSYAIADCKNCSLDELIEVLKEIRTKWKFTFFYSGIDKQDLWVIRHELGNDF